MIEMINLCYCRSSVDDDGACFDPMLIVFGGYNGSHHFDDTWLFDTRKTRWLEKRQQVHPLWPPGCTDDDEIIANSSCFLLDYAFVRTKTIFYTKISSNFGGKGCTHSKRGFHIITSFHFWDLFLRTSIF